MSNTAGVLYVVATPIGNLEDITYRAVRILANVDLIAAEDTRHTRKLLQHFRITTAVTALHEHNERLKTAELVRLLQANKCIALVSDAGTPLISDPGFGIVRAAHAAGVAVVPVPGPCAAIAALSVAGLPTDRFVFEGFPPAKAVARTKWLQALEAETRTLVFYEAPHRVQSSLKAMASAFGEARAAVLARELTKKFETLRRATLGALRDGMAAEPAYRRRGEFVILVAGAQAPLRAAIDAERVLRALLRQLPLRSAVALAAEISGQGKQPLYRRAPEITQRT